MTKNNSLPIVTDLPAVSLLAPVQYALILPHTMPDGDTIGSSVALFLALKQLGIQSWIVMDDMIPRDLQFLAQPIMTTEAFQDDLLKGSITLTEKNAIAITVDLSDLERLQGRKSLIDTLPLWNLDHHVTNLGFGSVQIIDSESSSTGELLYRLLKHWNIVLTSEIAEALYVAIATDTGSFKYANTTPQTHRAVADLLEIGIDRDRIALYLYHSEPSTKLKLHGMSLGELKIYACGHIARAYVSQHMLLETGAHMTESDGLVERIRDIEGIDTVILLKEISPCEVKISMRSIGDINVSKVALSHGGGGHKNAAGFTLMQSLSDALTYIDELVGSEKWLD